MLVPRIIYAFVREEDKVTSQDISSLYALDEREEVCERGASFATEASELVRVYLSASA